MAGRAREQLKMLSRPPPPAFPWPHGSSGAAGPSHWLSPGYSSLLFSIFPACGCCKTKIEMMPAPPRVGQRFPGVGIMPKGEFPFSSGFSSLF